MAQIGSVTARCGRIAAATFVIGSLLLVIARADEPPLPVVTAKNVAQHADKSAAVETTVVEVKFAERRKMYFLSATGNFRSEENLPVAIKAANIDAFQRAGVKDLSAKYLNHKIRAQGQVTRDEGQWLIVVTSPDQIKLLDGSPLLATSKQAPTIDKDAEYDKPKAPAELVIVNENGKRTVLAVPLPKSLPRSKVMLEHDGQPEAYEGVTLAALLEKAGVTLGSEVRGSLQGRYLVVTANDGYAAVFSVAEIDPFVVERPAIVAERLNEKELRENRAPLQVVVPLDKQRRRWVGQVIRIEVRNALQKPADRP